VHIDDFPYLGDAQFALGILFSCVIHRPSYRTWTVPTYSSFVSLLAGFNKKIMQICEDIMGSRSWESFQGLLVKCRA
jgi:hypothetical protein